MKSRIDKSKEILVQKFDLPRDIMFNLPKITIIFDNEIIIEGHKGIFMFTENEIQVNTKLGVIILMGENLEILYIGGSTIILKGNFESVLYDKYE